MDQAALVALVDQLRAQGREASTVEFKSSWDLPRDIGEYLSALANAAVLERHDHAYMVWGVNDQMHEVTGTTFKPFTAKGEGTHPLIMWLTQSISPRPDFEFYEVQHPQGPVVVLDIKAPRTAPLAFAGVRCIFVSAKVAQWTGQKASYIRNKGLDDGCYRKLVTDYLKKYGQASRKDMDDLLLAKLPDVLDAAQKAHRIRNLLQAMRRDDLIHRTGPKATAIWRLGAGGPKVQS